MFIAYLCKKWDGILGQHSYNTQGCLLLKLKCKVPLFEDVYHRNTELSETRI